jgi:hypothetical protein
MFIVALVVSISIVLIVVAIVLVTLAAVNTPYTDDIVDVSTLRHAVTDETLHLKLAKDAAVPQRLSDTFIEKRDALFEQLVDILNDHNIDWWMVRSSLLAAARNGSFLPWHDHVKIAVTNESLELLNKMSDAMPEGFNLSLSKHGFRFSYDTFIKDAVVEIDVMSDNGVEFAICTPLTVLGGCSFRDTMNRREHVYDSAVVLPLQTIPFNLYHSETAPVGATKTINVPVPNDYERCLDIMYGSNWNTVVERTRHYPSICHGYSRGLFRGLTGK